MDERRAELMREREKRIEAVKEREGSEQRGSFHRHSSPG